MNTPTPAKTALFALITLIHVSTLFAQAPAIEWQHTIGGTGYDFLNSIQQTSDGGYIVGGYSESNIGGDKSENNIGGDDYWIVKLDASGAIEWENTVGGGNYDRLYSVAETADGGFILGGQSLSGGGVGDKSESNKGGYDYWVVKLNSDGTVAWNDAYGGTGNDQLYNIQPTSDGGYILAGTSDSGISGDKTEDRVGNTDFWILKLDALGNIEWQNDIGGVANDYVYAAYETADGGYILGGTSFSGISGDKTAANFGAIDYWVVKLDNAGVVVWDKTFGGTQSDYLYNILPTADGGYIAVGMSEGGATGNKTDPSNGLFDYWILKLDDIGNITWQNSIGGSGQDYVFVNPVQQTADGGYVVAGYSQSIISGDKTEANTGSWDYWIVQLDASSGITWQTVLGGASGDYANAIDLTDDGGYIIGGYSYSGVSGEKTEASIGDADYWVIKLEGSCTPTPEICNGIDDDCNGLIDDDVVEIISISAAGPTAFCRGENVLLEASYSGVSVQWKKNGTNIPGATSSSYVASTKAIYTCETTSDCGAALSNTIFVNVLKSPPANITAVGSTIFCPGDSVVLTANSGGGLSYQWYLGASALIGANSISYAATTSGNYKCRVTRTATGCYKFSNKIMVTASCKEGVTEDHLIMNLYPSPAEDFIRIVTQNNLHKTFYVSNALGQVVLVLKTSDNEYTLNIQDFSAGLYVISMDDGMHYATQKFIKL